MICRSDLRTCFGALFNKLRAGDNDAWAVIHYPKEENYGLFALGEKDVPWTQIQEGNVRPILCMHRLELCVLLSHPVMDIFKEVIDANTQTSVSTGE